ncbi:aldose epimerase [Mycobacteriaceae bacterium 1482268.1]|nr:aldose epimerase [Mycobacteriaceae bacterium 1482268.1]
MPEFETVTLRDPSSSLSATYVPAAGMICTSLSDDGVEFLGQRRGLDAYVSDGKTMGIPLLYPWANRLSASAYRVDGGLVSLSVGAGGVRADEHGLPIHGVLAAYSGWLVTAQSDNTLTAVLDYGGTPRLLAAFPFPHVLTQQIALADRTLTIETTVVPTTAASVPLCFGYHPYLTIPGVPRQEWVLTTPTMRRLPVDDRGIPTGVTEDWNTLSEPLDSTAYDDGFEQVPDGALFALEGGDRRIEVRFEKGYPAAQLFAPPTDELIAIEPMAAPTDALCRGDYRSAAAGKPESARFSITVSAS